MTVTEYLCHACGAVLTSALYCPRCRKRRRVPTHPALVRFVSATPVRRCTYCGKECRGTTCAMHADLPALDRAPRDRFDPDALALERWADELLQRREQAA